MCIHCHASASPSRRGLLKMLAALPMAAAMPAMAMSTGIENYRPVFECARTEDGREVVVIRRFVRDGRRYALTIETRIRPEEWLTSDGAFEKSPYLDALAATTGGPYPIENAGLRHARHAGEGYFLTVDMCPSFKPFEGRFFETLVAHARRDGMPFPVAISISGFWALDHAAEFATLIASSAANSTSPGSITPTRIATPRAFRTARTSS
jgi:hypothetical protein